MDEHRCLHTADIARMEEKLKTHEQSINDFKEIYEVVRKLTENIASLTQTTKTMADTLGDVKKDVEGLKAEPGKDAKRYRDLIIGGFIGLFFSALSIFLFKGGM